MLGEAVDRVEDELKEVLVLILGSGGALGRLKEALEVEDRESCLVIIGDVRGVVCIVMGLFTGDCVSIDGDGTSPTKVGGGAGGGETADSVDFFGMNSPAFGFKGACIEADDPDGGNVPFATAPVFQSLDESLPDISMASLGFETATPKRGLTPGRDVELEPSKLDFSTGE